MVVNKEEIKRLEKLVDDLYSVIWWLNPSITDDEIERILQEIKDDKEDSV